MRKITTIIVALALSAGIAACGGDDQTPQQKQVEKHAARFKAYLPQHDVELGNYNRAQKLYDSPNTIIWCTSAFSNPSAPIITTPVAGKLTSSSTTFFRPEEPFYNGDTGVTLGTRRSVDGLFHPNPPPYRYGFTPGGQYIDYFGIEVQCTTALTKVQRQKTLVDVSPDAEALRKTADAERLLKAGKPAAAQQALQSLGG